MNNDPFGIYGGGGKSTATYKTNTATKNAGKTYDPFNIGSIEAVPNPNPKKKVVVAPPPKPKSFLQKAGGVASSIGKSIAQPFNDLAHTIALVNGGSTIQNKTAQQASASIDKSEANIHALFKAGKLNKQQYADALSKVNDARNSITNYATENTKQVQKYANPVKVGANAVQVGADILTAGGASPEELGIKAALGRGALIGGASQGVSSVASQLADTGKVSPKTTGVDVGLGTILGAIGGGANEFGLQRASKAAQAAKEAADAKLFKPVDKVAAKASKSLDAEDKFKASQPNPNTKLLGSGADTAQKRIDEIDKQLTDIKNGKPVTTFTPTEKTVDNLGTSPSKTNVPLKKDGTPDLRTLAAKRQGVVTPTDSTPTTTDVRSLIQERKTLQTQVEKAQPKTLSEAIATTEPAKKDIAAAEKAVQPKTFEAPGSIKSPGKMRGFVRQLASKTTILRKINTPSAGKLADSITNTEKTYQDLSAKYFHAIPTVRKLKGAEVGNFWDTVAGNAEAQSPKVQRAVKEWTTLTPKVRENAIGTGLKVGERPNYLPQTYDFKAIKKNPQAYNKAIQHLVDSGQAKSRIEAISLFNRASSSPSKFGHFQSRTLDIGEGFKKDLPSLLRYLDGAARTTAETQHLGVNGEKGIALLKGIAAENGDHELATKVLQNYLHASGGKGGKTLEGVRAFYGAARLGKATLSHSTQTTNVAIRGRVKDLVSGWVKHISANPEFKDFVDKTGVNSPANLKGLVDQATSLHGTLSKITAPGLTKMMETNRSVAALAGRDYGKHLAKKGAVDELKKLGVTGDIGKTLTPEQEVQAARGMVNDTMFTHSRADTPLNAETPVGKTIGQYRLSYGYKQTKFLYDNVVKKAAKGDLRPLSKFIALSAPLGIGTVALKSKISGTPMTKGSVAESAIGALGGIPGELAVQTGAYAKKNIVKTGASSVAPLAGEAVDIGQRVQSALDSKTPGNRKFEPIERYGVGLTPVVGNRVANKILPYTNKPSATQEQIIHAHPNQAAYKDFFQTQAKDITASQVTKQVKSAVSDGNYNKAKRLADDHNAKVDAKIKTLESQAGGLTHDTKVYLDNTYKVNYNYYVKQQNRPKKAKSY